MSKTDFLSILSIQSERLRAEYQKPGWNIWALLGAFSSLCWIILELYSKDRIEFYHSILIVLIIIISEPLAQLIYSQLSKIDSRNSDLYKNIRIELHSSLLSSVYSFFICLIILGLSNWYFEFGSLELIFINVVITIAGLGFLFMIVLSRINFHIKKETSSNKSAARVIASIVMIFTIILVFVFGSKIAKIDVVIVESAMLYIGVYFLLRMLIKHSQTNPLLLALDKLIDRVTFDEISIEEAEQQLYVIVNGIGLSQIFAPLLSEYQNANNEYHNEINQALTKLSNLEKDFSEIQKNVDTIDDLVKDLESIKDHTKLISSLKRKIDLKIAFYYPSEKSSAEYLALKSRFETLDKSRDEQINIFDDRLNIFVQRAKASK